VQRSEPRERRCRMNDRNDDAAVDLDELAAKANAAEHGPWTYDFELSYVHNRICRPILELLCDSDGQVHDPTGQFIAAADPSTVLAVIARCRDAEALIPRYQADLRANAKMAFEERQGRVDAEQTIADLAVAAQQDQENLERWMGDAQALRTALEAMVGLAYENTIHSILPEWQCRYCIRRNRDKSLVIHRDDCPVPAAEKALALGTKGETT